MGKIMLLPRGRARRGQTIVIVALSALVLLGLVALAVDGGSALVQRRNMQNAADAAALAAAQLMQSNMTTSCTAIDCHPTYLLTNQDVLTRVQQLTTANGAQNYMLEYHFNTCGPGGTCYSAAGPGTDPLPPLSPNNPWIDGVRVTARISATTTFAQAINIPFIPVQAVSAARLYPTCVPADLPGAVLPLTRFRPALETELSGSQGVHNDLCHPLKLWDWHPGGTDVPLSEFSNVISFNDTQFHGNPRTFSSLDGRNGPSGGLGDYIPDNGSVPTANCDLSGISCAYMDGSPTPARDKNDIMNWIFWQWGLTPSGGVMSTTHEWDPTTNTHGTWYPANRANQGGSNGGACCQRPGDWTDVYQTSDISPGTNDYIQDAVGDLAHYKGGAADISSPAPGGVSWGNGINANLYLWGSAATDFGASGRDDKSAQIWLQDAPNPNDDPNCGIAPNPPCNPYTGWEDITIASASGGYFVNTAFFGLPPPPQINRVRFTRAVRVRLYENLNSEAGVVSSYCPTLPDMGLAQNYNTVWGYVMNIPQTGPTDAALCPAPGTWMPGGGVYSRLIDPDAP